MRRRRFQVVRVTVPHFRDAERLIRRLAPAHNLRTLDAIQLAVALDLHGQGLVSQFVSADHSLCSLAGGEGLGVVNPERP
ncbi:MAG: hypothetical protein HYS12_29895 [Planctomycetes bacterium]|nr:hypothetical protein [Planctomycetota bacterium]